MSIRHRLRWMKLSLACLAGLTAPAWAAKSDGEYEAAAKHWLASEFNVSTLTPEQQLEEMRWFIQAAKPMRGQTVYVVSERIFTHGYEANVLARAFEDITGIKVVHEVTGEDDLVRKLQAQIQTGENLYDAYINDSDLIGTHYRSGEVVALSDYMIKEGKDVTLPTLDLNDFIGLSFTTGPDGKVYQLPDQQFANLYWYRHDWFSRPDLRERFKRLYGYELGVPLNWSAYEDIAEFFTLHVKKIDGQRVWGHMDYASTNPSLGWRISDAWLGMAGMGDPGLPNGFPVDEWGIRVEGCNPVGATMKRGGALDSPAAVYGVRKFIEWLNKYAPPEAKSLDFVDSGSWVAKGQVAQQIFWYTAFMADVSKPGSAVMNPDGTPKWKIAPSPRGAYWDPGMKSGYQDAGSWTFLKNTPEARRKAAWLYAQFTVSKTVSLKKTLVGLTPIRESDVQSAAMTERAAYLGGFVEFYRSRAREFWTPTGTNVPDYPRLSSLWWQHISKAITGSATVEATMAELAEAMDDGMAELAEDAPWGCKPILNPPKPATWWLEQPGAPKPKRNEKPQGRTATYEESLKLWNDL